MEVLKSAQRLEVERRRKDSREDREEERRNDWEGRNILDFVCVGPGRG